MFDTLMVPQPNEKFEFELIGADHREYRSAFRFWTLPFVKIAKLLHDRPLRQGEG